MNGDKATIPEGFTIDETENVISKGLVVHGPDKANGDDGSEFVWVPVPDINSMAQCSTAGGNCNLQLENGTLKCKTHNDNEDIVGKLYSTTPGENFGTMNTTYNANMGLREPSLVTGNTEGTGKDYDNSVEYNQELFKLNDLKLDYKNMATSVAKYAGFYVGRYETSLSDATNTSSGTKSGVAQSKQGKIPTSSNNEPTKYWYGLYKIQNKTYTGTNNSVESSMIWGSQYDALINWIKNSNNEKEKLESTTLGNNSSKSITITGSSDYENDRINNVRDLGGNLMEWTLEAYNTSGRISRGGTYNYAASPSYRLDYYPSGIYSDYGSRLTLYIK